MSTTTGGSAKRMDNPTQRQPDSLKNCPRCHARTKQGMSCRSPAVAGKRVCRMHGGKGAGAPQGERNGMWRHGGDSSEAVALRRAAHGLMRSLLNDG